MLQVIQSGRSLDDDIHMGPILSSGISGIIHGSERAAESSVRIVQSFSAPDLEGGVAAIIDLSLSALEVRASAAVIQIGKDLQSSVLSIIA